MFDLYYLENPAKIIVLKSTPDRSIRRIQEARGREGSSIVFRFNAPCVTNYRFASSSIVNLQLNFTFSIFPTSRLNPAR